MTGDPQVKPPADAGYRDPSRPTAERVEDLLARMTVDEKVAQLVAVWPGSRASEFGVLASDVDVEQVLQQHPHGVGAFTRPYGSAPRRPREGAQIVNAIQRFLVERTRLGVPALIHEECLTGPMTLGGTNHPAPLGWGASFDPELVEALGALSGRQLRPLGVHQGLAPVLDVPRDQRWGRVEECIAEDPYLVGVLGGAYVRGLQGAGVAATVKHFAGHAAAEGGHNIGAAHLGPRELADVHLVPFEIAFRIGRYLAVMPGYQEIDGIPASASRWLLTEILRERLGFTGVTVSDYNALQNLVTMHATAADRAQAAAQALAAGVDLELPGSDVYRTLAESVRSGAVEETLVDRAVRRVLSLKFELGIFDAPFVDLDRAPETHDGPEARALARRAADASLTLLRNEGGLLPLSSGAKRIAVIGPVADAPTAHLGNYSFPLNVAYQFPNTPFEPPAPSILESIRARADTGCEVRYAKGCEVLSEDTSGFDAAVAAAEGCDVAIVVVGDQAGHGFRGTVGEGTDRDTLTLPGVQEALVRRIVATGTPTVVVLTAGRGFDLGWIAAHVPAVLCAWLPGEEGGPSIADALFGRVNPAGRCPVSFARAGQQPCWYNQRPISRRRYLGTGAEAEPSAPTFSFGHGLSYTTFDYSELTLEAAEVPTDGELRLSVTVRNSGARAGDEVVQVYTADPVSSVVRPPLELRAFRRISLAAGESMRLRFSIPADLLSFTGAGLERIVEPGALEVLVGASSQDLRLRASLTLTGPERRVGPSRQLLSRYQ